MATTSTLQDYTCNDRLVSKNPSGSIMTFGETKWHYWMPLGSVDEPCNINLRVKYYANHESQALVTPLGDWNYVYMAGLDLTLTCIDP